MARRSPPDLNIVPMIPGKGRSPPPRILDQTEARAWNDIIDALPGQWVDLAGQLVLRRVCAQVGVAERLEERLRRLATMEDDAEAMAAEEALAVMHRGALKAIVAGLTALRATPRSRMAPREGRNKYGQRALVSRPWDIVAAKSSP
jgi:hypothetical protein